jgi:hypothetical protein
MNAQTNIDGFLLKRLAEQSGQCLDMASVLLATDEMLKAAQGGHWDRVSDLESSRRKRMDRCFAQPIMPENSEIFSEALAIMLHMNEELVALLESAKAEVAAATKGQTSTVKNLQHYLAVESSSS